MIIGICGLQNSGKDTLANILVEKHGFKKLSYASTLKDIVSILFGWSRDMIEGATKESRIWREQVDEWWSNRLQIPNLTPRYILQYFGTDLFRTHFHQDIWIASVEHQFQKYSNVVITDCRFPNEINILKIQNTTSKLIKIIRGDLPEWFTMYESNQIEKPENIHPSEYMWIKQQFDYTIKNNGTIKDLEDFCDKIIK
jgi:hypothetical protein